MEISKGLQLEIQSVQSKLKNAIRDHQICVGKLKDDPNNPDILDRIQEIQLHIVSLGRCQKQVVQRLRKEVDDFKAVNANDVKVSVASLLGLNNNNHITANNESRNDDISGVRVVSNGLDNARLATAKEDYEDIVRNGDVTTHRNKSLTKGRSVSVETLSADDEEVMEVSSGHDERENKRQMSEEPLDERRIKCSEQLNFLGVLGLITTLRSKELQNRRAERKRRSTANPQFVYSNWDVPTKKKRYSYLQSAGNVPQTRQTTARLNGPSPPPSSNKPSNLVVPPKSTSPPTRALSKSLVPTQKATTRPNILRNMSESRVFPNKTAPKTENENGQPLPLTCTTTKTSQSTTNSKTVHIPGLPSGLTIERIENDSAVCINCRNPGILTNCDNCEANYHVSCHSISPPPPRLCPKCASKTMEPAATIKKNEELVATSYAPGVVGKAGEDPEVDKASRGFYKIGTNSRHQIVGASSCINKLSGSTFLIPIVPNALSTSISLPKSGGNVAGFDEPRLNVLESDNGRQRGDINTTNLPYTTTILVNNHLSRSSVTYVPQTDSTNLTPYSYKFSVINEPKKLHEGDEESRIKIERREGGENQNRSYGNESRYQDGKTIGTVPGIFKERKESVSTIPIVDTAGKRQQRLERLTGRVAESLARGGKKSSTRAVPGLTRIVQPGEKRESIVFVDGNNDNVDELQKFSYNGRVCIGGSQQSNNGRNCGGSEERRESEDLSDGNGKAAKFEVAREPKIQIKGSLTLESLYAKYRPKPGDNKFHSLFPSYNKPDTFADCIDQSKFNEGSTPVGKTGDSAGRNEKKCLLDGGATIADGSERFKVVASTEHVKLEEAHLSAPSRAKLMRNIEEKDDKTSITKIDASSDSSVYRLFPNRRRTTEDRLVDWCDNGQYDRRPMPRILMRTERKSLDSQNPPAIDNSSSKIQDAPGFSKNYSYSFVRLPKDENRLPETESTSSADTSATEDASSPARTSDDNSKTSLLNSNGRKEFENEELEKNEDDDDDESPENTEIDDEETEDNEEDVEDEEDQDCPIVDDEIREEAIEGLRISTVSPESMQVLEQFENAMMQVENGDKTANL